MLGGDAWDRASEALSRFVGSWEFVLTQAGILVIWFAWNVLAPESLRFDPYPFILANLFMSAEAAFATPVLLMSSNKAAASDRRALYKDVHASEEALVILQKIERKLDGNP
jgi:uncharacterized membrane protein